MRLREKAEADGEIPGCMRLREKAEAVGEIPGCMRLREKAEAEEEIPGCMRLREKAEADGEIPGCMRLRRVQEALCCSHPPHPRRNPNSHPTPCMFVSILISSGECVFKLCFWWFMCYIAW
ncbi:hypothetical protein BsWGS_21132 [Bradybaena similaris]